VGVGEGGEGDGETRSFMRRLSFDAVFFATLVATCASAFAFLIGKTVYDAATEQVVGHEPIGRIVRAQVIPTSFNEDMKTMIETDRGSFVVLGIHSVFKGDEAELIHYRHQRPALHIKGYRGGFKVLGY
jgi:hypothetical protein